MQDNINMDSNLPDGNSEQPSSPASSGGVQPGSETVNVPRAKWEQIEQTIKRLDDETRSNKDRAVKKTNERMDKFETYSPVLERLADLMAIEGVDKNQAMSIMRAEAKQEEDSETMSQLREFLKNGKLPTAVSPGSGAVSGGRVAGVAKEFDIDVNTPEVTEILREHGDSEAAEKALLRLAAKQQQQPSAGASSSMEGRPVQKAGVEELTKKYIQDMNAAAGKKELVKSIIEKARKDGVPVDRVAFV